MVKKKIIPVWVSLMTRSLSQEKFNKKAGCRPTSKNGYRRIQYVPSPWMMGKQVALQEQCAVLVWKLLGNAGLRHAVVGQNWQRLKLCVGFLKTMKSLWLFKGISFFHDLGRISWQQKVGTLSLSFSDQLEVGSPAKTGWNAILSREIGSLRDFFCQ